MEYDKFLTKVSRRREFSKLREIAKYIGNGKHYALSGGVPTPEIFRFDGATFRLRDGSELEIDAHLMEVAQQYGTTEGYEPLHKLITNFQSRLHSPPNDIWATTLTAGCQNSINAAFQMILEEGDYLIGGYEIFSGALEIVNPLGINYLGVESDEHGMKPDSLLKVLSRWTPEFCRQNKQKAPKMIYVVPTGGNPDSLTIPAERRRQIYKIAQEYDLLILEDDPYQFIVYDQEIPPSFLSLDTDGRVLRCDSISKTLAPGFRIGILTAAKPFVDAAVKIFQTSTQQPCCLSQVVYYKLLLKWGFEGFLENANKAREAFRQKKDMAVIYAKKWLGELTETQHVSGGLFLWIKIKGVEDTAEICTKSFEKMLLVAPGNWFTFGRTPSPYIRVSFATATEDEFENGIRVLAEVIREHLKAIEGHTITNGTSNGY